MKNKIKYILSLIMIFILGMPSKILAVTTTTTTVSSTNGLGDIKPEKFSICDSELMDFIRDYWGWIIILAPMLLMLMGTIDFIKALASNDADAMSKAVSSFIKRTIATLLLSFLPMIMNTLFDIFGLADRVCL